MKKGLVLLGLAILLVGCTPNIGSQVVPPKNFGPAKDIYAKYKTAAESDCNTMFLGRLATYKYLDMWMAVKQVMQKLS